MPITGIEVTTPVKVGPIIIVPLERCRDVLAAFEFTDTPAENLKSAFENGTSYALAVVDASTLHEAILSRLRECGAPWWKSTACIR